MPVDPEELEEPDPLQPQSPPTLRTQVSPPIDSVLAEDGASSLRMSSGLEFNVGSEKPASPQRNRGGKPIEDGGDLMDVLVRNEHTFNN